MQVGSMICFTDFRDLCLLLSLRGSFDESCKVGVMEFGLQHTHNNNYTFGFKLFLCFMFHIRVFCRG